MGWESSDVVIFDLWLLVQGHTSVAKLKSAYKLLIIVLKVLGYETNLEEIMGYESSDVVRFDLCHSFKVKQG